MTSDNELIGVMRKHEGGLGSFLTEKEKCIILESHSNHPENRTPIDMKKFIDAANDSFKSMPLTMLG